MLELMKFYKVKGHTFFGRKYEIASRVVNLFWLYRKKQKSGSILPIINESYLLMAELLTMCIFSVFFFIEVEMFYGTNKFVLLNEWSSLSELLIHVLFDKLFKKLHENGPSRTSAKWHF